MTDNRRVGHGEKYSRKKELAVIELIRNPTIQQAAQAVGVGESTLLRWLRDPSFKELFHETKRQAVTRAVTQLQQTSSEAVTALREVMVDSSVSAAARVSAAKAVLELSLKALEAEELEQRICALEVLLVEKSK